MQAGETCPIENLNMGKRSCPPAVGRGGVRSKRRENEGRKEAEERDMKT